MNRRARRGCHDQPDKPSVNRSTPPAIIDILIFFKPLFTSSSRTRNLAVQMSHKRRSPKLKRGYLLTRLPEPYFALPSRTNTAVSALSLSN